MVVKNQPQKDKKRKIRLRITDTTLRDAHQSLWATRLRIQDIIEIIDVIDSVGYYSLEMWGGATFDVCLRFLRENPWERLRIIKSKAPNTPLQMLLRGQNILGYKNYADDLLDRFIALSCHYGIDIFRVFDALNDTRNLEHAIKTIKRYDGHVQGTLSYTISPYHTIESYVKAAKEQVELGIDTLCIKDMAGILSPIAAEKLVSALVKEIDVPIQLHCHSSSGMATATYVEAVRAGAGAIDCAISPVAGYSSQPPVETMVAIFEETVFDTGLDLEALREIAQFFEKLALKMKPSHQSVSIIDPEILIHQIPGGMISNLRSQLAQQKALDRLDEVFAEIPKVRADLGYPPLVTPTSQIVGIQSVINVLSGERYKMVPNETRNYVKGLYGRPPAPIDPDFIKKILGDEKPITHRPADDIESMLPKATENLDSSLIEHEEDIISYCLFPEPALEYFKWRSMPPGQKPETPVELEIKAREESQKIVTEKTATQQVPQTMEPVTFQPFMAPEDYHGISEVIKTVNQLGINELVIRKGEQSVTLKADSLIPGEVPAPQPVKESVTKGEASTETIPDTEQKGAKAEEKTSYLTIDSPLVGKFYTTSAPGKQKFFNAGSIAKENDTVCIVEAMKLINEIKAPFDCKIIKFLAEDGEIVEKDQALIAIEKIED